MIDLDEKTISELLAVCQNEAKKHNFVGCENCKLKFACWTHRIVEEDGEEDKRFNNW